jgi:predicted PurR-regulated permease PerM
MKLEIPPRTVVAVVLTLAALLIGVRLWPVVLLLVTAFIFQAALLPYVDWLIRRGWPRTLAVLAVALVVLLVLAGLVALIVPALIDEFQALRDNLPSDARQLEKFLDNFGVSVSLEARARDIDWAGLLSGPQALDYGQRVVQTTLATLTVIVLTIYLLVEAPRLSRFVYRFVPSDREADARRLQASLVRVVGGYIRGQVITSVVIAVYTFVVLLVLGVPNPLAFGALAGFADVVPLVGAFIAVVPASVAAFHESPTQAVIVIALLVLYQQFEDRFLVPRVYSQTLNLPPLVVLVAVISGQELLGITGVLLALPAAAVARVAFDYWMEQRGMGEQPVPATEVMAPDDGPGG